MTTRQSDFLMRVVTVLVMGFVAVGAAEAQDTSTPAAKDAKTMDHSMMGKMDIAQMHTMMGECMKMHSDGKMCDKNTMNKCQENMGKAECKKMMKHTKAQSKTKTK